MKSYYFFEASSYFWWGGIRSSEYSAKKFHPIDINILDANADLVFNVFCKVQDTSEDRFVLYASKKPRYRDKVRELLQSPEFLEELYIHEDDLTLYFKHATNPLGEYMSLFRQPKPIFAEIFKCI